MSFNLHYTQHGKQARIKIEGNFVIYSIGKWKALILEKINDIEVLLADFEKVSHVDSAAIQILISTKKFFIKNNKKFTIVNHSSKLIEYLDIYGLIGCFEDKILVSAKERENYQFRYGLKRLPKNLKL